MLLSDAISVSEQEMVVGTEEEFYARFEDAQEMTAKDGGYPSKAELEKALKQRRLWTMVDDGDGSTFFVSGYHFANRMGYWKSKKPYPQGFKAEYRLIDVYEDQE
jgi:hypothetical protein